MVRSGSSWSLGDRGLLYDVLMSTSTAVGVLLGRPIRIAIAQQPSAIREATRVGIYKC